MRKRFFCAMILAVAAVIASPLEAGAAGVRERDALSPEDAELLVRSVAAQYGEMPYAARVGVIAVILNRVEADGYPDTAAGVISTYRNEDGSLRFTPRALDKVETEDPKAWRMTRDAYLAVISGADVTEGALNFELIDATPRRLDFDFDDRSEDEHAREMRETCKRYKLALGGVGFW